MNKKLLLSGLTAGLLALTSGPAFATASLTLKKECILRAVAFRMNVSLNPSIAPPDVRPASETPIQEFDDAVEPQWGMRPGAVLNVYVPRLNRIYILDDAAYYAKLGRYMDDSLAHEYAHFIQVRYKGLTMEEFGDFEESEAVAVQTWFRDNYFRGTPPAGAPACR